MAKRSGELLAGPPIDGFGGGEFGEVDVDDGGVGLAKSLFFGESLGVDFLSEREAGAAGFGEADDFLQPVRAGGLDVESGTGAGDGALDGGVD